jgi:hypothetical protein
MQKKYWTHHPAKHENDVSNFFICDFQPKDLFNDFKKPRKPQKAL